MCVYITEFVTNIIVIIIIIINVRIYTIILNFAPAGFSSNIWAKKLNYDFFY